MNLNKQILKYEKIIKEVIYYEQSGQLSGDNSPILKKSEPT